MPRESVICHTLQVWLAVFILRCAPLFEALKDTREHVTALHEAPVELRAAGDEFATMCAKDGTRKGVQIKLTDAQLVTQDAHRRR